MRTVPVTARYSYHGCADKESPGGTSRTMSIAAPPSPTDVLREAPTLPGGLTLPYAQAPRQLSLSVLTPVFNERHLVLASLARVLTLESELISRSTTAATEELSTAASSTCSG